MALVLRESRKQLIELKKFIIIIIIIIIIISIIIMIYSQRVLLTEFTDFIYHCYCICLR